MPIIDHDALVSGVPPDGYRMKVLFGDELSLLILALLRDQTTGSQLPLLRETNRSFRNKVINFLNSSFTPKFGSNFF